MIRKTIAKYRRTALPIGLLLLIGSAAYVQHDFIYYRSYPKQLTTRFYFSQKYTALTLRSASDNYFLNYRPNTTLNMGVGATYGWATLNLAYGFGFLNPAGEKNKTEYLDLQFHGYAQKFNLDVLGQFYKGFYLYPKNTAATDAYYQRPDLRVNIVGASFQYIVNNTRFSFRSTTLNNEWQRKSAGTFLVGLEAYGGRIKADSTLVPTVINAEAAAINDRRIGFFEVGPNIGYAYTLVIRKSLFITGSVSASLDYGFNTTTSDAGEKHQFGFSSNNFLRLGTGYNTARWAVSLVYINNSVKLAHPTSIREATLNTGNLRLHFVYRFNLGKREKRLLEEVIK